MPPPLRDAAGLVASSLMLAAGVAAPASGDDAPAVDYTRDVRPILAARCYLCHGPDVSSRRADLRLDLRDAALADLGGGFHAIVPGDPEASELWLRVTSDDPQERMPPKGEPLTAAERAVLRRWIEAGAPYDRHWAYEPMRDPAPPAVPWGDDDAPVAEAIDAFVAAKLRDADVAPSPEADRRTLIRRATFDLTGLPPAPEEIGAFLADDRPDAYARLVDRLLASPAYGERWGRHWLDVARYADSNGVDENTAFANAHRYRDWVIGAFNANMPYDRFVRMQLAGDLLPEMDDPETAPGCLAATGFLAIGPKVLAEPDKEKMVFDLVDEQIDVLGKAFLAQTLSCARCHDHKFDPVAQAEYFGMVGILKSTRTMATLQTVARTLERSAETRGAQAARAEHAAAVQANRTALAEAEQTAKDAVQSRWLDAIDAIAAAAWALPALPPAVEAEAGAALTNLIVDDDQWGVGIGVVRSNGQGDGRVEWTVAAPRAAEYELHVRYASAEARPVTVHLDDAVVAEAALADPTGSFFPDGQRWAFVARFALTEGSHRIAFSSAKAFPHLDRLRVAEAEAMAGPPRVAERLAAERGLPATAVLGVRRVLEEHPAFAEERAADDPPAALAARVARSRAEGAAEDAALRDALLGGGGALADAAALERAWDDDARRTIATLRRESERLAQARPPEVPMVLAVADADAPEDVALHVRGDHTNAPGPPIRRGMPASISGPVPVPTIPASASGRRELAEWILDPEHPLTARVFVNRVWHWHFGRGLVDTPSDFGTRGGSPSHPALIDRLARDFVAGGWDVKALHRRIMLSRTYRQSSRWRAEAAALDPDERLLWRWTPRRLEAEAIRDTMLAVGGRLDRTMGGSLLTVGNFQYVTNDQSANAASYDAPRRSVYLPVIRNAIYPFFATFDYADAGIGIDCRPRTTIAPQALFMLNSAFVAEQAQGWAARLLAAVPGDAEGDAAADRAEHAGRRRIAAAYHEAFGRAPSERETAAALEFLASRAADGERRAWELYAQVLLATSEMITIE